MSIPLIHALCSGSALASWPVHVLHAGEVRPSAVRSADLDGDGIRDVVLGEAAGTLSFSGLGAGAFGPATPLPPWHPTSDLLLVDLGGDGLPEAVGTSVVALDALAAWTGSAQGFGPAVPLGDVDDPATTLGAGDLDGDGDPDLVVAIPSEDGGGSELDVLIRRWDGTFEPRRPVAVGSIPAAVRAADLDGDGDQDLLVAWAGDHDVAWNENLGGGTFAASRQLDARALSVSDVRATDLDRDGDLDVVAGVDGERTIVVYENQGAGVFGGRRPMAGTFAAPIELGIGDLDGDGDPEVAAADGSGRVWALANLGLLGFGAPVEIGAMAPPSHLELADLDGDVDLDVIAAGAQPDGVVWLENALFADLDRDGLADAAEAALGADPRLADTDGGGRPDGEEVRWGTWPGDPLDDGTIDADGDLASDAAELAAGSDPGAFDTDGDGAVDGSELAAGTDAGVADSDGDGWSDGQELACATDPLDGTAWDTDCDGLTDAEELASGCDPEDADTDGDGLDDGDERVHGTDPLAPDTDGGGAPDGEEVASGHDPLIAADDWRRHVVASESDGGHLAAVDLEVDGDLDVVVSFASGGSDRSQRVVWFENLGTGAFGSVRALVDPATGANPMVVADVDLDGLEDLVLSGHLGHLGWFRAGERIQQERPFDLSTREILSLDAADLDGDGDDDFLCGQRERIQWVKNAGATQFWEGAWSLLTAGARAVRPPDVDGDGVPDVVTLTDTSGNVAYLRAKSSEFFEDEQILVREGVIGAMTTADLDADGDPDVIVAREGAENLGWIENRDGAFPDAPAPVAPLEGQPTAMVSGDLDGDGDDDLVVGTSAGTFAYVASGRTLTRWLVGTDVPRHLVLADLDADGRPDVLASTSNGVLWYASALPPGTDPPPPEPPDDTGAPPGDSGIAAPPSHRPRPDAEPAGCGCAGATVAAPGGPLPILVALALAARARRRRLGPLPERS